MINNMHQRQLGIFKPNNAPILVVGVGGIGSMTVFALAKMGCSNITVVDFDIVEEHNVGSQFFNPSQIGKTKVSALAENVLMFTGVEIQQKMGVIKKDGLHMMELASGKIKKSKKVQLIESYEVIIMAVDSMDIRKEIWPALKDKFQLLIDGRMGGQVFNIYTFYNFEQSDYPKSWPPQEEIVQEVCTEKAICFNTFAIAANIAATVKKYHNSEEILRCLDGCLCNFLLNYTNDL